MKRKKKGLKPFKPGIQFSWFQITLENIHFHHTFEYELQVSFSTLSLILINFILNSSFKFSKPDQETIEEKGRRLNIRRRMSKGKKKK